MNTPNIMILKTIVKVDLSHLSIDQNGFQLSIKELYDKRLGNNQKLYPNRERIEYNSNLNTKSPTLNISNIKDIYQTTYFN